MDYRLATIQSAIGSRYVTASTKQKGCQVYMDRMPSERILIDADLALPTFGFTGSRCDFILFLIVASEDLLVVAPIELKGGGFKASKVSKQLQSGARFAEKVVPVGFNSTCQPILFHAKGVPKAQRTRLNRQEIRYRGKVLGITTTKCSQSGNLRQALKPLIPK